jgi:hypothetical protein
LAAPATAPPVGRRLFIGTAAAAALLLGAIVMMVAAVSFFTGGGNDGGQGGYEPSAAAIADIPPTLLPLYLQAGQSRGIDWAIVAAIGKVEADHGRSTAGGVHDGVNFAGCCAGPMQFSVTGPGGGTWGQYGVDGDGDGRRDVYNPADAIPAAADYLKANGAPGDYERAIFAYNHASWYVAQVLAQAQKYRGSLKDAGGAPALQATSSSAREVLRLADGPRPRITLTTDGRNDLSTGQIDDRVTSLLVAIAQQHRIVVTVLKTGHSYTTTSGNASNHAFGRAADIGVVDGQACDSTRQGRTGSCWQLAVQLSRVTGPLQPTELIYGIDPDGPHGPAFACLSAACGGDHSDHVHFGWDR